MLIFNCASTVVLICVRVFQCLSLYEWYSAVCSNYKYYGDYLCVPVAAVLLFYKYRGTYIALRVCYSADLCITIKDPMLVWVLESFLHFSTDLEKAKEKLHVADEELCLPETE